jgi:hypothetical protein
MVFLRLWHMTISLALRPPNPTEVIGIALLQDAAPLTFGQDQQQLQVASTGGDDESVSQGSCTSAGSMDAAGVFPSRIFKGLGGLDSSSDDSSIWDDESNIMTQDSSGSQG